MLSFKPTHSQAVLIATATMDRSLDLADLPQAENNVKDLLRVLTEPRLIGMPTPNVAVLVDADAGRIFTRLAQAVEKAKDALIVYFAGHGLLGRSRNSLLLPTPQTKRNAENVTSIDFASLAEEFDRSEARVTLVIIDTCFSERALAQIQGGEEAAAQVGMEILAREGRPSVYGMASASKTSTATSKHPYTDHTLFTGELLRVLSNGLDNRQRTLTFESLFQAVRVGVRSHGGPEPKCTTTSTSALHLAQNAHFALRSMSGNQALDAPDAVSRGARLLRRRNRQLQEDGVSLLVKHKAVRELIAALGHERPDVRAAGARGLAKLRATEALPYLVAGIQDASRRKDDPMIPGVVEALASYGTRGFEALFGAILSEEISYSTKRRLVRALAVATDGKTVDRVLREAEANELRRLALVEAALKSGAPVGQASLAPVLRKAFGGGSVRHALLETVTWVKGSPLRRRKWLGRILANTYRRACLEVGSGASDWVVKDLRACGKELLSFEALTKASLADLANAAPNSKLSTELRTIAGVRTPSASREASSAESLSRRLFTESGKVRRDAVDEIGKSRGRRHVPMIAELLKREENQNVRETAIKALGSIGGEAALTILERIWFGSEPSRFGKQAARNAIRALGAWRRSSPLLNPSEVQGLFAAMRTSKKGQDHVRGRARQELLDEVAGKARARLLQTDLSEDVILASRQGVRVPGFWLTWEVTKLPQQWYHRVRYRAETTDLELADKLIGWGPVYCDGICLTLRESFEAKQALLNAKTRGMTVELVLDDRVRVSAKGWRGLDGKDLTLDVIRTESGCTVEVDSMPHGACEDWQGCVRLLIRAKRWLEDVNR